MKIKLYKTNKNINIIGSYNNIIIFVISSNQIKINKINILKKILIEKLSELGIKKIFILKNDLKYINKNIK